MTIQKKRNPLFLSISKLMEVVPFQQRKLMLWLIPLMVIVGLAEVINIGIIIPYIGVLINPEFLVDNAIFNNYLADLDVFHPEKIRLTLTLILISTTIGATFLKVLLIWLRTKLSFSIGGHVSRRVFRNSLEQPFELFSNQKSSDLVAAMTVKADNIAQKVILPILTFMSGLTILLIFLVGLVITMPTNLLIGCLGIVLGYIGVTVAVRSVLMREGKSIAKHISSLFHLAKESLDGFAEIKIYSVGNRQFQRFSDIDTVYRSSLTKNSFLSEFPKSVFESLVILGFAAYCYSLIGNNNDSTLVNYIPILGGLAYVAQKMIPVLQQVYNSWSTVLATIPIVDDVLKIAKHEYKINETDSGINYVDQKLEMEFKGVGYCTPSGKRILNDISFSMNKGENIALVGQSGSGKTTFFNIASLMLAPTDGEVCLDSKMVGPGDNYKKGIIGYCGQSAYVFNATIAENITMKDLSEITASDHDRVNDLLARLGLVDSNRSNKLDSNIEVGPGGVQLSGGEKQRISIARMMFCKAKINFLDESTSALDSATEEMVLFELFKELREVTVLFITHRSLPLKFCNRVITFDNGKLIKIEDF
ncbi:ABC transporter ATP-binding protein/permease [Gammaproteobacteria bacterium]|nr:ABC transporter ATP-binding protein/permease [Gammaproteobacteria bacterium]